MAEMPCAGVGRGAERARGTAVAIEVPAWRGADGAAAPDREHPELVRTQVVGPPTPARMKAGLEVQDGEALGILACGVRGRKRDGAGGLTEQVPAIKVGGVELAAVFRSMGATL